MVPLLNFSLRINMSAFILHAVCFHSRNKSTGRILNSPLVISMRCSLFSYLTHCVHCFSVPVAVSRGTRRCVIMVEVQSFRVMDCDRQRKRPEATPGALCAPFSFSRCCQMHTGFQYHECHLTCSRLRM